MALPTQVFRNLLVLDWSFDEEHQTALQLRIYTLSVSKQPPWTTYYLRYVMS